jgi:DNA-binding response OmpR family regulator
VVDDDDSTLTIVDRALGKAGFSVRSFQTADRALESFREEHFDLVLSDFYMPGTAGDTFLRRVRRLNHDIPFVFLTANADVKVAVELVKSGADDHIVKPIVPEQLVFRVNKNLQEKANERRVREVEKERELVEMEKRKLVNWRELYAAKDINQTEQMINLLSRTINQEGGFLWLDLLKSQMEQLQDGRYAVPDELMQMVIRAAESQKTVFEYLSFIAELDKLELAWERVAVEDLVDELKRGAEQELTARTEEEPRRTQTVTGAELAPGRLEVDRSYLGKIVRELVINAVKYSPRNGRIIVGFETDAEGRQLRIRVQNTARHSQATTAEGEPILGIPYDYSELVFDLFYTIEAFPTELEGEDWIDGTGLYVSRKLLRRHGGWITAANGLDYTTGDVPETMVSLTVTLPMEQGA